MKTLCFICQKNYKPGEGVRVAEDVQCDACNGAGFGGWRFNDIDEFTLARLRRMMRERIDAIQTLVVLVVCEKTGQHPLQHLHVDDINTQEPAPMLNLARAGGGVCDCKTCVVFYNGFLSGMTKALMMTTPSSCACSSKLASAIQGRP